MRLVRRIFWTLLVAGLVLLAALTGLVLFLTRAQSGLDRVLDSALKRAERSISGSIAVEEISSPGLLSGATLRGITVRGPEGEEVFRADSVFVRYSVRSILFDGEVILSEAVLWAPKLTIRQLPGGRDNSVGRLFEGSEREETTSGTPGAPPPSASSRRRIGLRNVSIHEGEIDVLRPTSGESVPEGALADSSRQGAPLRRYAFTRINGEFPRISLVEPERDGEVIEVRALSLLAQVGETPFAIEGVTGEVVRAGEGLVASISELRLPRSNAEGTVAVRWDGAGIRVDSEVDAPRLALNDLSWIDRRLSRGEGKARLRLEYESSRSWMSLHFEEFDIRVEESRLSGRGSVIVRDGLEFRRLRVRARPLDLARVEPWLRDTLPVEGLVRGETVLNGPLDDLEIGGRLTLRDRASGIGPASAEFAGALHLGDSAGVSELRVNLDSLDYRLVTKIYPELKLAGEGSLRLSASGRFASGVEIDFALCHASEAVGASCLKARGRVRKDSADLHLDLRGEADPLSLALLGTYHRGLKLVGTVEGPVHVQGTPSDLSLEADLSGEHGRLSLDARVNARDPAAGYRLEGEMMELRISEFVEDLSEPLSLSGSFSAQGSGLDRETVTGSARIALSAGEFRSVRMRSATASIRAEGGSLHLDSLSVVSNVGRLLAHGGLALDSWRPGETIDVTFQSDSIGRLRDLFMGPEDIRGDTLSPPRPEPLEDEGIGSDSLPGDEPVAMSGRVSGEAVLEGAIDDFSATGTLLLEEFVDGRSHLGRAEATFSSTGLPRLGGVFDATITSEGVGWEGREYERASLDIFYSRPRGNVALRLERSEAEEYWIGGDFEADSAGRRMNLDELRLRFEEVEWTLERPATLAWNDRGLTVEDFRLLRSGIDGMRLGADGILPFGGEGSADFRMEASGLRIGRLGRLAQFEREVEGLLDLSVRITGRAGGPPHGLGVHGPRPSLPRS